MGRGACFLKMKLLVSLGRQSLDFYYCVIGFLLFGAFIMSFAIIFRVCIKVYYSFKVDWRLQVFAKLFGFSFQFCQTVIRGLHSSLIDANHSRDVEPILSKE